MKAEKRKRKTGWKSAALGLLICCAPLMPYAGAAGTALSLPVAAASSSKIILDPGEAGSLQGRTFAVYKVLDATVSANRDGMRYSFNAANEKALKAATAASKGVSASSLTQMQVLDYMEALGIGEPGSMQSSTSVYRSFIETLRTQLERSGTPLKRVTIRSTSADGSYTIDGLGQGYFVVIEETDTNTLDHPAAISLCLALSGDGTATRITLKNSMPLLIKKIQEDSDQVWNDIGDYQSGQNVPYRLESVICNLDAYASYFVSFHDVMDKGLEFDPGSLKVELIEGSRTIRLASSEYTLVAPSKNETFEVRISDVKTLLNRYFPSSLKKGVYGQTIRVSFDAKITQEAFVEGQGASGLENSARLEFSNDPRTGGEPSHGYTPWDTVVCFSYMLDVNKTDMQGKPLEGAHFILCADKAGRQKIHLKKGLDGYVVMDDDEIAADPNLSAQDVEIVSSPQGKVKIYGLDEGVYYLHETQAPDGYLQLAEPVKIELKSSFGIDRNSYERGFKDIQAKVFKTLGGKAELVEHFAGSDHTSTVTLRSTPSGASVSFDVVNRPGTRLPLTGSNTALLCLGGGTLMVAGSLLFSIHPGGAPKKSGDLDAPDSRSKNRNKNKNKNRNANRESRR